MTQIRQTNKDQEHDRFGKTKVEDVDNWGYDSTTVNNESSSLARGEQDDDDLAEQSPSTASTDTSSSMPSYSGGTTVTQLRTIEDSSDDESDDCDEFGEESSDEEEEDSEEEEDEEDATTSIAVAAPLAIMSLTMMMHDSSPSMKGDMPPSRPRHRRSFEEEYSELKTQNIDHTSKVRLRGGRRDALSQSEHVIGGALRNMSNHSQSSLSRSGPSSRGKDLAPALLFRKASSEDLSSSQALSSATTTTTTSLHDTPRSRLQGAPSFRGKCPPSASRSFSRSGHGKTRDELSVSEHTGQQQLRRRPTSRTSTNSNAELSASQHGQVTLRAGPRGDRVLLGSNELSSSQHLRRQPPSRTKSHTAPKSIVSNERANREEVNRHLAPMVPSCQSVTLRC
jgi:hypothetical protein